MKQWVLWFLLAVCLGLLLFAYSSQWLDGSRPAKRAVSQDRSAAPPLETAPEVPRYVADISAHSVEALNLLFDRVEKILTRPRSDRESALVSLVLHGPEVEFFALRNYGKYKSLVDRAARLDALGAIDVSICQTQMRKFGISKDEVPAFLEQVPYGPDEVQRLLGSGYVYM